MPTHAETIGSIHALRTAVETTLKRCREAPYSSAARVDRIQEFVNLLSKVSGDLQTEVARLEAPIRAGAKEANDAAQAKQTEILETNQRLQKLRTRPVRAQDPQRAEREEEIARLTELVEKLDGEAAVLAANARATQAVTQSAIEQLQEQLASDGLARVERRLKELLDEVGAFETQVLSEAGSSLARDISTTFKADTAVFSEAETHHKTYANYTALAMAFLLGLAGFCVYWLFIRTMPTEAAALGEQVVPKVASAPIPPRLDMEHVLLLVTGRLAILFFFGWAFRYLSVLYRAHAEQAVTYRDRMAALGVAEVIVNATPVLEQKLGTLRSLADAYINVGRSAFSPAPPRRSKTPSFDAEVRQLKKAVDAVKPVFDAVGGIVEKTKP